MKKKVIYYIDAQGRNPVWRFITSLASQERDKCFEYIAYLEAMGQEIRRPIGDYLGNKLYELRPKSNRLIYFFMLNDYAVLVHAFRKKTDAIPESDLKIAHKRVIDFIARYKNALIQLGG